MKTIIVVISTYNGEKYIERQLDSLRAQKDVDIICYIRDDGSSDNTVSIIKTYEKRYNIKIILEEGENIGWRRSFLKALKDAPKAEYYAFCDQDDIWLENKLSVGINMMMSDSLSVPKLFHCARFNVNNDLKKINNSTQMLKAPLNRKNAMVQEYCQGCAIILNAKARDLVLKYQPDDAMSHDFWSGLLVYLFGKIYYSDIPLFYYIHHDNNASVSGTPWKARINRLKNFFKSNNYQNPARDLILGYEDMLSDDDISFLRKMLNYKTKIKDKLSLLFDSDFKRSTIIGTISLKISILLGRY